MSEISLVLVDVWYIWSKMASLPWYCFIIIATNVKCVLSCIHAYIPVTITYEYLTWKKVDEKGHVQYIPIIAYIHLCTIPVLKVGSNLLVCFLNCLYPQFQLLLIAVFILQDLKTESIIVFLIKIYVDLLKNGIKILM